MIAISCILFHLRVSIGIGRMSMVLKLLYLSLYMLGWSFNIVCIGKYVGYLRMYEGVFGGRGFVALE